MFVNSVFLGQLLDFDKFQYLFPTAVTVYVVTAAKTVLFPGTWLLLVHLSLDWFHTSELSLY